MNIDWRNAPADAIGAFFRFDHNARGLFFVRTKEVSTYQGRPGFAGYKAGEAHEEQYHVFSEFFDWAERPSEPAIWSGEGLPPVGAVCEYKDWRGDWHQVEITAIARKGICFVEPGKNGENYCGITDCTFRPIRTPEQIAAEEREKAVKNMLGVILNLAKDTHPDCTDICEGLYDAGYRKVDS